MNIVMLFSTDIPVCEGIGTHVLGLAKRLRARGHHITLMTRGDYRGTSESEYEGFRVIKVAFYPLYPFHVYLHRFAVQKAIGDLGFQPDIIHLHSPLVPCLKKKWPMVTTFHTPMLVDTAYVEDRGLRTILIKLMGKTTSYWIEKKLINMSDALIAVSSNVADELVNHYSILKDNISVISNIVDVEYFKPDGKASEKKMLLFVGRLAYRKGLFELVRSAGPILRKYPDFKYVLVGDGPLRKDLEKLVERMGLNSNFEFYGEVRDPSKIVSLYQNAWAVMIPSYYESGPITLLEAMACGKAVITTPTGLAQALVEDGVNGLIVSPKSVEELAEATIKILSDKDLCKRLGDMARQTVVEKMNPDKNTEEVINVYNFAINRFKANIKG
jgi:glycosyltransferase involved in cell wall biosynthesis